MRDDASWRAVDRTEIVLASLSVQKDIQRCDLILRHLACDGDSPVRVPLPSRERPGEGVMQVSGSRL